MPRRCRRIYDATSSSEHQNNDVHREFRYSATDRDADLERFGGFEGTSIVGSDQQSRNYGSSGLRGSVRSGVDETDCRQQDAAAGDSRNMRGILEGDDEDEEMDEESGTRCCWLVKRHNDKVIGEKSTQLL